MLFASGILNAQWFKRYEMDLAAFSYRFYDFRDMGWLIKNTVDIQLLYFFL